MITRVLQTRLSQFMLWSLLACVLISAGCTTHADRLRTARDQFYRGDLNAAVDSLQEYADEGKGDRDVLELDTAVVNLSEGDVRAAEKRLRVARDRFAHLQQTDLAEEAVSFLTDDSKRAYAGEDYERLLIQVFLALSSLMGDGRDATPYALQIQESMAAIVPPEDPEAPQFEPETHLAIAPYLLGLLAESTHSQFDEAVRNYTRVATWQPTFTGAQRDLERAQFGRHSERGNGVVYIFALVGRGPYKVESTEKPTSAALLVADRILSATGKHTLPPTVAPIKVPRVARSSNAISGVHVSVDGQDFGATETITDVTQLAIAQNESALTEVVGRAVARRVVKKAVVYSAKEASNVSRNSWVSLALDVAGVAWEASESADTRCWGLLPDKIQVLRVEVPAGAHRLTLRPVSGPDSIGEQHVVNINVENGRNTYVLANFPTGKLAGTISTATH